MDKGEFLRVLRERLSGEIPEYKVQEHIRYYDHYLSEEIRSGKTEKEAIEALGSPYLIAKTILDMEEQEEPQEDEPEEGETFSYYYKEDEQPQTGYRRKREIRMNTWSAKIIAAAVIFVIVMLLITVFALVGSVVAILVRFLFPVLVIGLVIYLFRKGKNSY